MAEQTQIKRLYDRWVNKTASIEEMEELFRLLEEEDLATTMEPLLQAQWQQEDGAYAYDPARQQHAVHAILRKHPAGTNVRRLSPSLRWAAAAILLIAVAGAWFIFSSKQSVRQQPLAVHDIGPGHEGAILTLADGHTIVLDSAGNGEIARQNGAVIHLQHHQLIYDKTGEPHSQAPILNTLSTPPGRQFALTLPDGTKLWLNAASSVRFPTQFTGKERRIAITGEAYLEIAADASHPFYITTAQSEVRVLGTSINMNAYTNEAVEKATLINGKIGVRHLTAPLSDLTTLSPGQQAQITGNRIRIANNIDAGQVTAWKNGLFNFEGLSFTEAMRQLERWYNIEVVYEKEIPGVHIGGKMTKGVSLNGLLIGLEQLGVHYRLDGRKLIILP